MKRGAILFFSIFLAGYSLLTYPTHAYADGEDNGWQGACYKLNEVFRKLSEESITWKESRLTKDELMLQAFNLLAEKADIFLAGHEISRGVTIPATTSDPEEMNQLFCRSFEEALGDYQLTLGEFSSIVTSMLRDSDNFSAADGNMTLYAYNMNELPENHAKEREIETRVLDKDRGYAYLRISSFANKTGENYEALVGDLAYKLLKLRLRELAAEPKHLVIDLRDNAGGDLKSTLLQLLYLLPELKEKREIVRMDLGSVMISYWLGENLLENYIVDSSDTRITETVKTMSPNKTYSNGRKFQFLEKTDYTVLLDEKNASSAEIFAYLLKRFRPETRLILVNANKTYGKQFGSDIFYYHCGKQCSDLRHRCVSKNRIDDPETDTSIVVGYSCARLYLLKPDCSEDLCVLPIEVDGERIRRVDLDMEPTDETLIRWIENPIPTR